jgi:hypothetical protein
MVERGVKPTGPQRPRPATLRWTSLGPKRGDKLWVFAGETPIGTCGLTMEPLGGAAGGRDGVRARGRWGEAKVGRSRAERLRRPVTAAPTEPSPLARASPRSERIVCAPRAAGAAGEDRLGLGAIPGAVAAPDLSCHHRRAQSLLGPVVGGWDSSFRHVNRASRSLSRCLTSLQFSSSVGVQSSKRSHGAGDDPEVRRAAVRGGWMLGPVIPGEDEAPPRASTICLPAWSRAITQASRSRRAASFTRG